MDWQKKQSNTKNETLAKNAFISLFHRIIRPELCGIFSCDNQTWSCVSRKKCLSIAAPGGALPSPDLLDTPTSPLMANVKDKSIQMKHIWVFQICHTREKKIANLRQLDKRDKYMLLNSYQMSFQSCNNSKSRRCSLKHI